MEKLLYKSADWEVLVDVPGVPMDQITLDFSPIFNRKSSTQIDESIDTTWTVALSNNHRLYDATKFRLADARREGNSHTRPEGDSDKMCIHLSLGMTSYKETFCTNHLTSSQHIADHGREYFSDPHACYGDALGVGGVVVSADGYVVLQKRAGWVAESQNCYDTPGGHCEPGDMLSKLKSEGREVVSNDDIFAVDHRDVVYELYHSFVREVRDEVNIPEESLTWPLLLGVNRNKHYGNKPGLIFFTQCTLSRDEISTLYAQGGAEADESTEIKFISSSDLTKASVDEFLSLTDNMAPLGRLALLLYVYHYDELPTEAAEKNKKSFT